MKITCPYCNSLFDDTKTHCPHCGAINEGVVRTSAGQPVTIDELKQWYHERGLPPYETTRFFIGEDYKEPRAFGIYQDPRTRNFVVYKNKDSGQRAIRYEGTDEAYAVNELYQRLKEEIIQQKRRNIEKKTVNSSKKSKKLSNPLMTILDGILAVIIGIFSILAGPIIVILLGFLLIIVIGIGIIIVEDTPKNGYYRYDDAYYYHYDYSEPDNRTDWFVFNDKTREWSESLYTDKRPEELKKNKKAKKYYLSEETPAELKGYSFTDSLSYKDIEAGDVKRGYYSYDNETYYYLGYTNTDDWYYFDTDDKTWVESKEVPADLQHSSIAEDFYYTPTWDSETQLTDFSDTDYYQEYKSHQDTQKKATESKWDNDNDDSDYNWDNGDSWDDNAIDWDSDW